jgi:hypothetical protein
MKVKALRNVSFQTVDLKKGDEAEISKEVYDKISNDVEVLKSEKIVEDNKILTSKDVKKK